MQFVVCHQQPALSTLTSDSHGDSQHKLVFSEIVASTITSQGLGALRLFQYDCVIEPLCKLSKKALSLVAALEVVVVIIVAAVQYGTCKV